MHLVGPIRVHLGPYLDLGHVLDHDLETIPRVYLDRAKVHPSRAFPAQDYLEGQSTGQLAATPDVEAPVGGPETTRQACPHPTTLQGLIASHSLPGPKPPSAT